MSARWIYVSALSLMLAACGGGGSTGGGSDTTNPPTQSPNTGDNSQSGGNEDTGGDNPPSSGSDGDADSPAPTFLVDSTARFDTPSAIAIDSTGNIYIKEMGRQSIRKIAPSGEVSTLPGIFDEQIADLAVDSNDNLVILDRNNIYSLAPDGTRTLSRSYGAAPMAPVPTHIGVDGRGRLYVMEEWEGRAAVVRYESDGFASNWGTMGRGDYGTAALAVEATGNFAVATSHPYDDPTYGRIYRDSISYERPLVGENGEDIGISTSGWAGPMNSIQDMVFDAQENLYITDLKLRPSEDPKYQDAEFRILRVTPSRAVEVVREGFLDGSMSRQIPSDFNGKFDITLGWGGHIFVTDPTVHAVYKLFPSGEIRLIAGTPGEAGNLD